MTQINSNLSSLLAASLGKPARTAKAVPRPDVAGGESRMAEEMLDRGAEPGQASRVMSQFTTGRDVANAVSFGQTQTAYLQQVGKALARMGELAVAAQESDETPDQVDRYQQEYTKLGGFIQAVAGKDFNGIYLFAVSARGRTNAISGGPSMPAVNLSARVYSEVVRVRLSDAGAARKAQDAINAAQTQLAADQAGVAGRVHTLLQVSEDLTMLEAQPESSVTAEAGAEAADGWMDSLAMDQFLAQPGMAILTQANINARAVSRLLHHGG